MKSIIRSFCAIVFLASLIGVCVAAGFSSIQYDMVYEQPGMGNPSGKVYIKGTKSRIEMDQAGNKSVTLFDGEKAFMYLPAQNMAIMIPVDQVKQQVPEVRDYKADCQLLGEESIDGRPCGIYQCSKGGAPVKMWIDKTIDFPLKTVASGMTMSCKNIVVNAPLDDSLFELPAGIKVQDMSAMMQGLQKSGGRNLDNLIQ